jgi:flagellar motor switch protein FliG
MKLSGREKATIFLSILGPETSAQVLRYLPGEVADLIASGINHLPTPSPEALGYVLSDFKSFLALPPSTSRPTPQMEAPAKPAIPREKMNPKDIILSASPKKLAFLLAEERPQIAAAVLSLFPDNERAGMVDSLGAFREKVLAAFRARTKTNLSAKLEDQLIRYFAGKL